MKTKTKFESAQLASDPDKISVSAADYAELTKFQTGFNQVLASVGELSEPFASEFARVKTEINQVLANLQPTDQVPAAQQADGILRQFMSMLKYTQEMMGQLAAVAKTASDGQRSAMASLSTEVQKEADAKLSTILASGEYLKKADLDVKVADAVAVSKSAWQAELKTVSDRRTLLASASICIPADADLLGEEADFTARKDKAAGRAEKLKPFSALKAERVTQLCWGTADAEFDTWVADHTATAANAKAGAGNPLATPPPAPAGPKSYAERARAAGF